MENFYILNIKGKKLEIQYKLLFNTLPRLKVSNKIRSRSDLSWIVSLNEVITRYQNEIHSSLERLINDFPLLFSAENIFIHISFVKNRKAPFSYDYEKSGPNSIFFECCINNVSLEYCLEETGRAFYSMMFHEIYHHSQYKIIKKIERIQKKLGINKKYHITQSKLHPNRFFITAIFYLLVIEGPAQLSSQLLVNSTFITNYSSQKRVKKFLEKCVHSKKPIYKEFEKILESNCVHITGAQMFSLILLSKLYCKNKLFSIYHNNFFNKSEIQVDQLGHYFNISKLRIRCVYDKECMKIFSELNEISINDFLKEYNKACSLFRVKNIMFYQNYYVDLLKRIKSRH
ncbi:MAG: hypothetical protein ACMXYG_06955 [Candidatus Woesearchaeota archaeon]